ncbi:MAG: ATP-dependent Clp protease adapter ClpS [Deltaproteobacteria bacterium]|nr:ATP-dependent Clp protease adapter ClpS [Deltaproteobacteria bacterium]
MTELEYDNLSEIIDKKRERLKEPPLYRVLIHNDHYTSMEFVVEILEQVFHHNRATAEQVMMMVHRRGIGCCGEYDREIAESKVVTVSRRAAEEGFPLRCTMEKI